VVSESEGLERTDSQSSALQRTSVRVGSQAELRTGQE
jgi:hypothetical protein